MTVSVGYRLGILGWLRCPGCLPGNLGLLDLAVALPGSATTWRRSAATRTR